MKKISQQIALIVALLVVPLVYNACGTGFEAASNLSKNLSSGTDPEPTPAPPTLPPPGPTHSVIAGAGGQGHVTASYDNFEKLMSHDFVVPPGPVPYANANDPSSLQCPMEAPTTLMSPNNYACCVSSDKQNCYSSDGVHSDFLYRGIAFGNGVFVATGGWYNGITKSTTDGITWKPRLWHEDKGMHWIPDVAFGNGRFVISDARGKLMWSTDGEMWNAIGNPANDWSVPHYRQLYFLGSRFFIVGDQGAWAFTKDGTSWQESGVTGPKINSVAVKDGYAYASTEEGDILKLNANTGTNWVKVHSAPGIYKLLVVGNTIYGFGHAKRIESTDGMSWAMKDTNLYSGVIVYNETDKTFVAHEQTFRRSKDGLTFDRVPDSVGGNFWVSEMALGIISAKP